MEIVILKALGLQEGCFPMGERFGNTINRWWLQYTLPLEEKNENGIRIFGRNYRLDLAFEDGGL